MKLGTALGYDLVQPEFLKHVGPKALTWLADLFSRREQIWFRSENRESQRFGEKRRS